MYFAIAQQNSPGADFRAGGIILVVAGVFVIGNYFRLKHRETLVTGMRNRLLAAFARTPGFSFHPMLNPDIVPTQFDDGREWQVLYDIWKGVPVAYLNDRSGFILVTINDDIPNVVAAVRASLKGSPNWRLDVENISGKFVEVGRDEHIDANLGLLYLVIAPLSPIAA